MEDVNHVAYYRPRFNVEHQEIMQKKLGRWKALLRPDCVVAQIVKYDKRHQEVTIN